MRMARSLLLTVLALTVQLVPPTLAGNAPKVIGDQGNGGYTSLFGDWRGQVQYQASYRGAPVADAHAIVQTTISIDPQGKIQRTLPGERLQVEGYCSPWIDQANFESGYYAFQLQLCQVESTS